MKTRTFVVGAACMVFVGIVAGSGLNTGAAGPGEKWSIDIGPLTAADRPTRRNAASAILEGRRRVVRRLIALAGKEVKPVGEEGGYPRFPYRDPKHLSILMLGDMRASEAVAVLVKELQYRNPRSLAGSYMDEGGWYPAAESLAKSECPRSNPSWKRWAPRKRTVRSERTARGSS